MSRAYTHLPWIYQGASFEEVPKGIVSFVYLLTDTITGKKYIGKKSFVTVSTEMVKGRRKHTRRESDWKKYYSSNLDIMALVKGGNHARFTREILHLCKTKGTASYLEAKEIFARGALETDEYYNYFLEIRVNGGHLKLESDEESED